MPRARILISACLIGEPVRYDGRARTLAQSIIAEWQAAGRLVPICPELVAGLGVPRPAAEISNHQTGSDVLAGAARVVTEGGIDVTELYMVGAAAAVAAARAGGCGFALLADGSPSCGSSFIYDGSFGRHRHLGIGVTTALLRANGIRVFADSDVDALAAAVK